MIEKEFQPIHLNATAADIEGNNGIGRYIFLPGSTSAAKEISAYFSDLTVKEHPRGHDLYLGRLKAEDNHMIDVAAISGGMGTPSTDIIMTELMKLGAKRFLRVGTAGAIHYERTHLGDFVIATGAVRDEGTSQNYLPLEFPAIASIEMVEAAQKAAEKLKITDKVHTGLLHTKDSLYAREFKNGPLKKEHERYAKLLEEAGVLASEMQASLMFIATTCMDNELQKEGSDPTHHVLSGVICNIISNGPEWATPEQMNEMNTAVIKYCLEVIVQLDKHERREMKVR